jgi:(p)ppGpp synthase/HD superfamily hydrolase
VDESSIPHLTEVVELVRGAGAGPELQAAALLHDFVEDTGVGVDAIERGFGKRVAQIVAAMTEDESIDDYAERKAEHRERARAAGEEVALLFVADKLSNIRRMKRGAKEPDPKKVAHYRATLETMRAAYPGLSLLDELEAELAPGTRDPASARSINSA